MAETYQVVWSQSRATEHAKSQTRPAPTCTQDAQLDLRKFALDDIRWRRTQPTTSCLPRGRRPNGTAV
jgi:hypothetical protein